MIRTSNVISRYQKIQIDTLAIERDGSLSEEERQQGIREEVNRVYIVHE